VYRPHPHPLKHFSYVGKYRYALRFCTHNRSRLFTDDRRVALVLLQIVRAGRENQIAIVVYCFMPDHLHLLVEGESETSNCKRFVARAKQYSAFHYSRQYGEPLWQRYGFDRVLRDDEQTIDVVRYILENPIRAGLAASVFDYPYVGSLVHDLRDLLGCVQ
jgi:putative transposase